MEGQFRTFSGPMVVITGLVAVGWFVLGALSFVGLSRPAGLLLGTAGVLGGLVTAWLALSLRVRHDDAGIVLPRLGHVPWEQVHAVEVQPGLVSVPYVVVRQGRALADVALDGLAWFGGPDGYARGLAEQVAAAAGLDRVAVRPPRGGSAGRRAA